MAKPADLSKFRELKKRVERAKADGRLLQDLKFAAETARLAREVDEWTDKAGQRMLAELVPKKPEAAHKEKLIAVFESMLSGYGVSRGELERLFGETDAFSLSGDNLAIYAELSEKVLRAGFICSRIDPDEDIREIAASWTFSLLLPQYLSADSYLRFGRIEENVQALLTDIRPRALDALDQAIERNPLPDEQDGGRSVFWNGVFNDWIELIR